MLQEEVRVEKEEEVEKSKKLVQMAALPCRKLIDIIRWSYFVEASSQYLALLKSSDFKYLQIKGVLLIGCISSHFDVCTNASRYLERERVRS